MSKLNQQQEQRRKVITLLGTGAVALPVLGLAGCGGGEEASSSAPAKLAADAGESMQKVASEAASSAQAAASEAADSVAETAESAMDSAEQTMDDAMDSMEEAADEATEELNTIASDATQGLPRVDESGPQASGLGYRHDATTVDAGTQTRYAAGQQCSNCVLFQGGSAEWGGCPLFAGSLVKGTGWCSAYSAAG
ncbi:MAG: high-potential iron-sulfur protein [Congregibacter sp.]